MQASGATAKVVLLLPLVSHAFYVGIRRATPHCRSRLSPVAIKGVSGYSEQAKAVPAAGERRGRAGRRAGGKEPGWQTYRIVGDLRVLAPHNLATGSDETEFLREDEVSG